MTAFRVHAVLNESEHRIVTVSAKDPAQAAEMAKAKLRAEPDFESVRVTKTKVCRD